MRSSSMPRLRLVAVQAFAIAALALLVPLAPAGAQGSSSGADPTKPESVLAVVTAERGRLDVDADGSGTLTLRDAPRRAPWFSDRPIRDTGTYSLSELKSVFFSGDDPPNAALEVAADENHDVAILELTKPKIEGRTLTFAVKQLDGARAPGVDGELLSHGVRADKSVGPELRDPALFIDSAAVSSSYCLVLKADPPGALVGLNDIDCFSALSVVVDNDANVPPTCAGGPSGPFGTPSGQWTCRPDSATVALWVSDPTNPIYPASFVWRACSSLPRQICIP